MARVGTSTALLAAGLLALSACSGSAGPATVQHAASAGEVSAVRGAGGVPQVTIHATDSFRFTPEVVHAHVGRLRIVLLGDGAYPHNISFPALHATSDTVSGNPGEQRTSYTVSFNRPGTYEFVCTFHSSAGMKGRVVVS
jgi:plastocyanin